MLLDGYFEGLLMSQIKLTGGEPRGPVLEIKGSEHSTNPDDFIFRGSAGEELIRFCKNGDIFIQGRHAENDKEIVIMFKSWLDRLLNSH